MMPNDIPAVASEAWQSRAAASGRITTVASPCTDRAAQGRGETLS